MSLFQYFSQLRDSRWIDCIDKTIMGLFGNKNNLSCPISHKHLHCATLQVLLYFVSQSLQLLASLHFHKDFVVLEEAASLCFGTKLLAWHFSFRLEEVRERRRLLGLETVSSAASLAPLISTGSPSCPGISCNGPHTIKLKRFKGPLKRFFSVKVHEVLWFFFP